jgi:hypothetical protein
VKSRLIPVTPFVEMLGVAFNLSVSKSEIYWFPAEKEFPTYKLFPLTQAPPDPITQLLDSPIKSVLGPPPGVFVEPDQPAPALLLLAPPDGESKLSLQNTVWADISEFEMKRILRNTKVHNPLKEKLM